MKKVSKEVKIVTLLTLLVLAFLATFNVTYSYFTAVATIEGDMDFGTLNVNFNYYYGDEFATIEENSLTITPILPDNKTSLSRGDTFTFGLDNGLDFNYLQIKPQSGSVDCYVRFWIDAYEVVTNGLTTSLNTETNYGQYFLFNSSNRYTNEGSSSNTSWCYYSTVVLTTGVTSSTKIDALNLGNQLTISDNAPIEILGKTIQISISFEAIQAANNAFSSASGFADEKGYLTSWK